MSTTKHEYKRILVIVESPAKARTIGRFLPTGYRIEASIGHVRDLPQSATEVPKRLKSEPWSRLSIDVEHDFKPLYVVPRGKSKIIRELKRQIADADCVVLATDEDREGESIAWHLVEVLKPTIPVRRMVFHEITREAIGAAVGEWRDIDMRLVKAQETRRILDRLFGYTLSPLVWKKIAYGLSAGRVQSPGLRMIVEREFERIRFRSTTYWDIVAQLRAADDAEAEQFEARLQSVDGRRIVGGSDFDSTTGALRPKGNPLLLDEQMALQLMDELKTVDWRVEELIEKQSRARPGPPYVTATLQQDGHRLLGLAARETMRIAQRLYEAGLITYMRTDSPHLSSQAIAAARRAIEREFGGNFVAAQPRQYSARSATAQEAHEAIRPAGTHFDNPDRVMLQGSPLEGREKRLYELIWRRALATQMRDAEKLTISVHIAAGRCRFGASGTRILFPGFLRVYAGFEKRERLLPALKSGMALRAEQLKPQPHKTKPPARYNDASLVERLESEGIGRPSTYATIIETLLNRDYVRRVDKALVPTFTGIAVLQMLQLNFAELIDYKFSSRLEEALDAIAQGERNALEYLKQFYLGDGGLQAVVAQRETSIDADASRTVKLPQLADDHLIRIGRFGAYVVWHDVNGSEVKASIPEDIASADLTDDDVVRLLEMRRSGPESLGVDPESGLKVYCLIGRYGPYLQLGEAVEGAEKPRRASLPRGKRIEDIALQEALTLLSLPRILGWHPESGKPIQANNGRFGPYVEHNGEYRSLAKDDDVYRIELPRALELLQQARQRRGARPLRELGLEPHSKKSIAIYSGRYGPYLKFAGKNIALPKSLHDEKALQALDLEQALRIVRKALAAKAKG